MSTMHSLLSSYHLHPVPHLLLLLAPPHPSVCLIVADEGGIRLNITSCPCDCGGSNKINKVGICTKHKHCDGKGTCECTAGSCDGTTNTQCSCGSSPVSTCTKNNQCNGFGTNKCGNGGGPDSGFCKIAACNTHTCTKKDENEYGPEALFTIADSGQNGGGSDSGILEFASTTLTVSENVGQILVTVTRYRWCNFTTSFG